MPPMSWWKLCCSEADQQIWRTRRSLSTGWPPHRSSRVSLCTASGCLRAQALLARALGDEVAYHDHRDRYRKMATDLGFEGHMAWSEAMD